MSFIKNIFNQEEENNDLELAFSHYKQKDYDKAIEYYTVVINNEANNSTALYGRALCYYYKNSIELAEEDFKQTISLNMKEAVNSCYFISKIYFEKKEYQQAYNYVSDFIKDSSLKIDGYLLRLDIMFKQNDIKKLQSDCEDRIKEGIVDEKIHFYLGYCKVKQKDYNKAISEFDKALQENPKSIIALTYRAYANSQIGKQKSSLKDLEKVLEIPQTDSMINYLIAEVFNSIENYEQAISYYSDAIKYDEHNFDAYIKRSEIYIKNKKYKSAINDVEKIIKIKPEDYSFRIHKARLKLKIKDYQGAQKAYEDALMLNDSDPELFYEYGIVESELKNFDDALNFFNLAITLNKNNEKAYLKRAIIRYFKKDYKESIKDLNTIIDMNGENWVAYYHRARAKQKMSDDQGALTDYTKALMDPNYFEAHLHRAQLKIEMKDFHSAITDLTKAIKLNPKSAKSYYLRALANNEQNNRNEALDDLNKAIKLIIDYPEALYLRGIIYYNKKMYKEAINDWEKTRNLNQKIDEKISKLINKAKSLLNVV